METVLISQIPKTLNKNLNIQTLNSNVEKNNMGGKYFILKHYEGLPEMEILQEDTKQTRFQFLF